MDEGPASSLVVNLSTARYNASFPDCISACVGLLLVNFTNVLPFRDSDFANMSSNLYKVPNILDTKAPVPSDGRVIGYFHNMLHSATGSDCRRRQLHNTSRMLRPMANADRDQSNAGPAPMLHSRPRLRFQLVPLLRQRGKQVIADASNAPPRNSMIAAQVCFGVLHVPLSGQGHQLLVPQLPGRLPRRQLRRLRPQRHLAPVHHPPGPFLPT